MSTSSPGAEARLKPFIATGTDTAHQLIEQVPTGELMLAPAGEHIAESYDFYAALAGRIRFLPWSFGSNFSRGEKMAFALMRNPTYSSRSPEVEVAAFMGVALNFSLDYCLPLSLSDPLRKKGFEALFLTHWIAEDFQRLATHIYNPIFLHLKQKKEVNGNPESHRTIRTTDALHAGCGEQISV